MVRLTNSHFENPEYGWVSYIFRSDHGGTCRVEHARSRSSDSSWHFILAVFFPLFRSFLWTWSPAWTSFCHPFWVQGSYWCPKNISLTCPEILPIFHPIFVSYFCLQTIRKNCFLPLESVKRNSSCCQYHFCLPWLLQTLFQIFSLSVPEIHQNVDFSWLFPDWKRSSQISRFSRPGAWKLSLTFWPTLPHRQACSRQRRSPSRWTCRFCSTPLLQRLRNLVVVVVVVVKIFWAVSRHGHVWANQAFDCWPSKHEPPTWGSFVTRR